MGVTRMGKTTIFLADDDEGVRRTLRTFFEGLPGYRVVGMREDEASQYIRELSRRKGMSMARVASYLLAQQEERHD